jgi:uncharacterized membrane protein SpoIIM required for sporulation
MLLQDAPQRIFHDRCVQLTACLFWGAFLLSATLAHQQEVWPQYAEQILTSSFIERMESDFSKPIDGRNPSQDILMAAFYIRHNTTIGLKCFAFGLLVVPGLFVTMFNSAYLGAAFGYMARPEVAEGRHFFQFVTAHGPLELTAIVLSAGAGLRLGVGWLITHGWTRAASLRKTAAEATPLMGAAMILFFLAALIEGFVSPSGLSYRWVKAPIAVFTAGLLMFYFVVLGFPRRPPGAAG